MDRHTVTRIKICGVMNKEDASLAIACGADALGFNFVPESPRYVGSSSEGLRLLQALPPFVARVAVCVTVASVPEEFLPYIDTLQFYSYTDTVNDLPGNRLMWAFR